MNHHESPSQSPTAPKVTPLRCLTGAGISGAIAYFFYFLSLSMIQTFAAKPLTTANAIALNIGAAVRTLVVGMGLLATGIFALTTLGLLGLALQLSTGKPETYSASTSSKAKSGAAKT